MEHHMTVRPTADGLRFEVAEIIPELPDKLLDRTYGRLDAAVARAWTLAKKGGVPINNDDGKRASIPLNLSIHPGRPHANPA